MYASFRKKSKGDHVNVRGALLSVGRGSKGGAKFRLGGGRKPIHREPSALINDPLTY